MADTVRQSVLEKLAKMEGSQAESLIEKEYSNIMESIASTNEFSTLEHALELLAIFVHRMPKKASRDILELIDSLGRIQLELPGESLFKEYFSSEMLQVKAIELLSQLRYLAPDTVIEGLFRLCDSDVEEIRNAASEQLGELANIDLNVFQKIGVQPQLKLLRTVETFSRSEVRRRGVTTLNILRHFLASNISGYSWDYQKVTISSGAIPAGADIKELRSESIQLLKQIYFYDDTVSWQKQVLGTLEEAASRYSQRGIDDQTLDMINNDTVIVLRFYQSLLSDADLQIVQKIEHYAYWHFYRSVSDEVSDEALVIEKKISQMSEYKVYRDLVGFEGIFVDWRESRSTGDPERLLKSDERRERAEKWAASVDDNNFADWAERIIRYCRTESRDLATFPAFYQFMEQLAKLQPENTLSLVESRHGEMESVLIPTLRGLWASDVKDQLRELMSSWIRDNQNLFACCRLFRSTASIDKNIFAEILDRAVTNDDPDVLTEVVLVTMDRFDQYGDEQLNSSFVGAIQQLTTLNLADWARQARYHSGDEGFLITLNEPEKAAVYTNLLQLKKIDYGAEEVLSQLGRSSYQDLIDYFGCRLKTDEEHRSRRDYEAIPFQFHSLDKLLAKDPNILLSTITDWYDGNYGMFIFRGAKLLANAFPTITDELEAELIKQAMGGEDREIEVVLAVLRNYQGEKFTHRVCQELVKKLPADHRLLVEVRIALGQTGVVTGEYGFTEAYKLKAKEMTAWLKSDDSKVRSFAQDFIESLNRDAERERIRADKEIELRKFKYGVDEVE